jgi:hypothetical protein
MSTYKFAKFPQSTLTDLGGYWKQTLAPRAEKGKADTPEAQMTFPPG